jgi:uncharacterized membrane protein
VWAAILGGLPILGTPWIWQSLVLFGISGLAFGFQVAPLQVRLRDLARRGSAGDGWDDAAYRRLSARWGIWGLVATLAPIGALALMVIKPAR